MLPASTSTVFHSGKNELCPKPMPDSSSDPSEEVLDDPTNIALSQRAPAHLQQGQVLPPHGDPLLAAARPVQKLPPSKDEQLPVKSLPGQQGQWRTKRGMYLLLAFSLTAKQYTILSQLGMHRR